MLHRYDQISMYKEIRDLRHLQTSTPDQLESGHSTSHDTLLMTVCGCQPCESRVQWMRLAQSTMWHRPGVNGIQVQPVLQPAGSVKVTLKVKETALLLEDMRRLGCSPYCCAFRSQLKSPKYIRTPHYQHRCHTNVIVAGIDYV